MSASDQPLLRLDGVTKVFLTDEVETHALSGIHMEIKKGEYISIAGPSGLRQINAAVHPRPARFAHRRNLLAGGQTGFGPAALRTRARSQPRGRIHLSKF